MNDELQPSTPSDRAQAPVEPQTLPVPVRAVALPPASAGGRWTAIGVVVLALLCGASLTVAVNTQQRVRSLERDLVRRQQDSQGEAAEARVLSRQAADAARDAAAKVALLDAKLSEATLQRSQLEELIQSLSRSRDENVVADVETSLRVALQQSAITGSAEPLVATLTQADQRLARYDQPRLERVRRAIARDLDRAKAVGVTDLSALALRLDEAVRQVDDLPLLSAAAAADAAASGAARPAAPASAVAAASPASRARAGRHAAPVVASAASMPAVPMSSPTWTDRFAAGWRGIWSDVWTEARSLVRVTRIDAPEAALVAPDQAFFLRENLKLHLLDARLAVLSREYDTVQTDLADAQRMLDRYFDPASRRVQGLDEQLRQVAAQSRAVNVPRPDETLAALAAAGAGR